MPQTSIGARPKGYAGQVTRIGEQYSASAQGAGIVAGQVALRGTAGDRQVIPIADGSTVDASTVFGWIVLDTARQYAAAPIINNRDGVAVMRRGRMYVTTVAGVTAGQPVYVGNTTATLGMYRGSAASGFVQVPDARFVETTSAAGLAEIAISLD